MIRKRRIGSIKMELIKKSRESALAAIQIFNNPTISFKSEAYIVLMIISWTYLLHAYYRNKKIEYQYFEESGRGKKYLKTKHGAVKNWELAKCLKTVNCPIDENSTNNLKFLIQLRNEIEHQMTTRLDEVLSAQYQACCFNYNTYIKKFFGKKYGIDQYLTFSLQFSMINAEQKQLLNECSDLSENIQSYIKSYINGLTDEEFNNPKFAYRVLFVPKLVNRKGQADRVIDFVKSDSPLAANINKEYRVIKEMEKPKYLPSQIVEKMKKEGYSKFSIHYHTLLWKKLDGKNPNRGFGCLVAGTHWHWFDNWVEEVRRHCKSKEKYFS